MVINLNKNYVYFSFFIVLVILISIQVSVCLNELSDLNREILANQVTIINLQKEIEVLKSVKIVVIPAKVAPYSLTLTHYFTLGVVASVLTCAIYTLFSTSGSRNISNFSSSLDKRESSSLVEVDLDEALNFVLDTKLLTESVKKIGQSSNSESFKGNFNTLRGCEPPEFLSPPVSTSDYILEATSLFLVDVSQGVCRWVEFLTSW